MEIGVALPDGTTEWKQVGVFYQANGGWKTGNQCHDHGVGSGGHRGAAGGPGVPGAIVPPTTLSGWLAALVGQLGVNFAGRYHVDPAYAGKAARVNAREDVAGKSAGTSFGGCAWPRGPGPGRTRRRAI